jgi:hypothetical protein
MITAKTGPKPNHPFGGSAERQNVRRERGMVERSERAAEGRSRLAMRARIHVKVYSQEANRWWHYHGVRAVGGRNGHSIHVA